MRDQDLISAYLPRIYHMARILAGNEEDAQDLAHETLVAALTSLGRFRSKASLSTWLTSILINHHRKWRRSRAIRGRLQMKVEAARPNPVVPSPEAELERSEQQAGLLRALQRLEGDERELVVLSYYQGLDSKQIGTILGRPAGTIRSRLHDIREKLRVLLLEQ
jgi:RNA polymerase sigma-70 factor, ECF subfamily